MAASIWKLLPSIDVEASRQNYTFMDMDVFNDLIRQNPERAQAIYWREMTLRIHLACCASLLRHADWLDTLLLAIEHENFFGTLAACRGLLESAADTFYSLGAVPKTLAPNLALIRARIKEKPTDTIFLSKELEDALIHFSHGRKLRRNEAAEPVHAAKQMREYLDSLKRGGVSDVHDYYSELCSIAHPSAETVMLWFEAEKDGDQVVWRRSSDKHSARIDRFLLGWRETNELVVTAGFMPALMSLRILHKLDFLPKIPSLRLLPLEKMPAWKELERHLRR
ncbi:hypothetical protein BDS110ZK4_60870 [Bradyrhizobium diazoefficiens]|nr:hypothetical protein XF4B_23920 [Bradyrhizobium diazoefficiens]BCE89568.1 hypothetical protein XF10B_23660 [Bradyrhizobium diazoefficiens]BCF24508.1 hypothetical protein XF14B_24600 [Bradyrhizobium diazoefficiens]